MVAPFMIPFAGAFTPVAPSFSSSIVYPFAALSYYASSATTYGSEGKVVVGETGTGGLGYRLFFVHCCVGFRYCFVYAFTMTPPMRRLAFDACGPSGERSGRGQVYFSPVMLCALLPSVRGESRAALPSGNASA